MTESLGVPDTMIFCCCSLQLSYLLEMLAKYIPKPKESIYVKCYANISFFVVNINSNSYGNDFDGSR